MTKKESTPPAKPAVEVKDFSDYLKKLRNGSRLRQLSADSGVSVRKLADLKNNPSEPIKYIDARRLCNASTSDMPLEMKHFDQWNVPDRERYETPLGKKVIASLLHENESLHIRLQKHALAHNQLSRIIGQNVKWSDAVKKKMSEVFDRGPIKITEEDYEDQHVDRLKAQWLEAARELKERRETRSATKYFQSLSAGNKTK